MYGFVCFFFRPPGEEDSLQGLGREDLCEPGEDELLRNGLDLADSLHEPSAVDSAKLVEGDLTVLAGEPQWDARRIWLPFGCHGSNDHGAEVMVHLIRGYDQTRPHLFDFAANRGVEVDEIDVEAANHHFHSVSSNAVSEGVSSSRTSSPLSAMRRNASSHPSRGGRAERMVIWLGSAST